MKRLICLCCMLSLFTLPTLNVHAAPTVTTDGIQTTIEGNEGDSTQQDAEVTVRKGSTFRVCVPKVIEVQPNEESTYAVGVYADIGSSQRIVVEPIDTTGDNDDVVNFMLDNIVSDGINAKPSVKASIATVKTTWSYDDTELISDVNNITNPSYQTISGKINANVTAGRWSGKFVLRIALENI